MHSAQGLLNTMMNSRAKLQHETHTHTFAHLRFPPTIATAKARLPANSNHQQYVSGCSCSACRHLQMFTPISPHAARTTLRLRSGQPEYQLRAIQTRKLAVSSNSFIHPTGTCLEFRVFVQEHWKYCILHALPFIPLQQLMLSFGQQTIVSPFHQPWFQDVRPPR